MKKKLLTILTVATIAFTSLLPAGNAFASSGTPMMRLYNGNSGEHFYTANATERNDLSVRGWAYEGVGWTAPSSGDPVYRLYNPNAGDHHYTTSAGERDALRKKGWHYEGIGWYSDKKKTTPLYRLYNPNAKTGTHHYTTSQIERNMLMQSGWSYEGIAWYGTATDTISTPYKNGGYYWCVRNAIKDAYIEDNTLVITAAFNYANDDYNVNESYPMQTYYFPINSASFFYSDDGEGGDIVTYSANGFAYAASHYTHSGTAVEIRLQNGYIKTGLFTD